MTQQFNEFAALVAQASAVVSEVYEGSAKLTLTEGRSYYRIVKVLIDRDGNEYGSSAWGFIDKNGMLWKCAGWAGPAKNKARGTVQDLADARQVRTNWVYGGVK